MTARTEWRRASTRCDHATAEFIRLDRAALVGEIRRLAALDVDEREILALTGLGKIDVRRALGGYP